ncbi:hypothetical protein N7537_007744 [Penicillium hordei]|uniref:Uncharacterized protein n=1 Tax=Penicillium hordei TaxID=40994 RepID=A0AAD6DZ25_9EURO|nr:uncharacterized protein N7537_007744 [Penicillium hordei]KAJ5597660.1 hypothetical protein N7537_007744 [Penicillium hordei]
MSAFQGFGNFDPNMDPNINSNIDPNIGPNIDPSLNTGFNPGLNADLNPNPALNPSSNPGPNSGPDSSTGANTGTTSTATDSTPQGSYWRPSGGYQPQYFADPNKLLCSCPNHLQGWWPVHYAELIIAPCAYRCPYCDEFNKVGRDRLMASNLRRHITKTHIEGNPGRYGTLVVAPGGGKARGQ